MSLPISELGSAYLNKETKDKDSEQLSGICGFGDETEDIFSFLQAAEFRQLSLLTTSSEFSNAISGKIKTAFMFTIEGG